MPAPREHVDRLKEAIGLDIWILVGISTGRLNLEFYSPDRAKAKLAHDIEELIGVIVQHPSVYEAPPKEV